MKFSYLLRISPAALRLDSSLRTPAAPHQPSSGHNCPISSTLVPFPGLTRACTRAVNDITPRPASFMALIQEGHALSPSVFQSVLLCRRFFLRPGNQEMATPLTFSEYSGRLGRLLRVPIFKIALEISSSFSR